jgi:hypothetical protein
VRVQHKFETIFGPQFAGHSAHLAKKLVLLKNHITTVDSKRHSTKFLAHDLVDIMQYTKAVETKVKKAIVLDRFSRIKNLDELGNLMEEHDRELGL